MICFSTKCGERLDICHFITAYANKVVEEFNSKLEENNKQIFTIAVDTAMKQAKQYKSSS